MREGGGGCFSGFEARRGASGEERIGVICLGRWSSGSRAASEESEERFLALPACGRQARNDDGVGMANWRPGMDNCGVGTTNFRFVLNNYGSL